MNKKFKKSSINTYSEDNEKKFESKTKVIKDNIKSTKKFNKALKDFDLNDIESFEELEYDLFEQKSKIKK